MADITKYMDKTPLYVPFVTGYKRTKTANGIKEQPNAIMKRYYSSIDAELYFGNEYVEDVCDIQWSLNQQNLPIFGFNSYTADEIHVGSRLISGTFSIRFTSPNYLFRILETAAKQNAFYGQSSYVIPTHDRILGEVSGALDDSVRGTVAGTNTKELWPQTFDIDIVYGKPARGLTEVHVVLEGVRIINLVSGASSSNPTPLTETYQFVAKDMKTLDGSAPSKQDPMNSFQDKLTTKNNQSNSKNSPLFNPTQQNQNKKDSPGSNKQGESTSDASDLSYDDIPSYNGSPSVVINNNKPNFSGVDASKSFENYSDLDFLGRCGVAFANVGKETMPTEPRGEIGMVKPSGWHTARYDDLIEGKYLYNRCHLIAFMLAGENANRKNLITGTRSLNVDGMLPYESQVKDYIDKTGNHVLYRVTPVFSGSELVARGVQMEAQSVEDNGEGLQFNVFCYNVQPGVKIDYATGNSERS